MMNFNKIIDSLKISDEMKSFFITGVENANGDILLFLNTLMEVMVEEEDYENAVLVRDTIFKIEKLIS
jgi:hypothetical protein